MPDADPHTGYCRAYVWRWRFTVPAYERDSPARWPCQCRPVQPWTMAVRPHQPWCVVTGLHRWHDCTMARTSADPKE